MSILTFQQKVFTITKKIPKGKVATYGKIARAIGKPKAARAVGNALNKNRDKNVPCHRVIKSDGSIGGYAHGIKKKVLILKGEGVRIDKYNKVALRKYSTLKI